MIQKSEYRTVYEWRKADPKGFKSAYLQGFLEQICELYGWEYKKLNKKPQGHWDIKENCINDAKKYKTKYTWCTKSSGAYYGAKKNAWFNECTKHMILHRKPNGYWTKEKCLEEALKYILPKEWRLNSSGSYKAAKYNEWYEECIKHMSFNTKRKRYWTKEKCLEEALKYKSTTEWIKNSSSSYSAARKLGILNDCTKYMSGKIKPKGYWTKENCIKEAKKYKINSDWQKNSVTSYNLAYKRGWIDECRKHMNFIKAKPKGYWTKENCIRDAKKYKKKIIGLKKVQEHINHQRKMDGMKNVQSI